MVFGGLRLPVRLATGGTLVYFADVLGLAQNLWNGAGVLDGVYSTGELEAAREGQERFYRGEFDLRPSFPWPAPRRVESRSRKHPYASFFRSELAALARHRNLAETIRDLTGFAEIRLWHDQLLWEEPRRDRVDEGNYQWHTERSRWKTCRAKLMVTAWIPLAPVELEMGPITMVPGSQRRRWIELPDGWEPDERDRQPVALEPGQVSLHCWHTVHGNPPNFGREVRRVLAVHFACGPIAYQKHGAFTHVNERVVRQIDGRPDFMDEQVCPLV